MRPILFEAFGLAASSAPVFAGLSAVVAWLWFEKRKPDLGWTEERFWGLIAVLAAAVFVGSIGGYALISRRVDWSWSVATGRFAVPGGTFLGALPAAVVALVVYCRLLRLPIGPPADVLAAAAPLGLVVMRIGCLLNGCCHGLPTSLPWGVVFRGRCAVTPSLRGIPLHPTQLYEAAGALVIFLVVDRVVRPRVKDGRLVAGDGMWASAFLYACLRFAVDFVRAQDPTVLIVKPAPFLSLVQWACLATIAACAGRFAFGRRAA